MDVLVAGAHGAVGQHATRLLAEHDDHTVYGMVRKAAYDDDIVALGATPVRGDVTDRASLDDALDETEADALLFAAGSSGADVWGVDRDGANNCVDACEGVDVERFVMLSAMNADAPEESPEELREYLRAKAEADAYLRESDLTYTITRPGALTDEDGTGRIRTGADLDRTDATIPRADVAATLVAALPLSSTYGLTFELLSGETPIEVALRSPLAE
ncbi:SDR family oxidoreductase [Halarchaeum salinum]